MLRGRRPIPPRWLSLHETQAYSKNRNEFQLSSTLSAQLQRRTEVAIRNYSQKQPRSRPSPTVRRLEREKNAEAAQKIQSGREPRTSDHLVFDIVVLRQVFDQNAGFLGAEFTRNKFEQLTRVYCDVLSRNPKTSGETFAKEYGLSPEDMYMIGAMLIRSHASSKLTMLGTQMLQTASASGYILSTMTLLFFFLGLRARSGGRSVSSTIFADTLERFRAYMKKPVSKDSPNALTLAGMLAMHSNDERYAMSCFRAAVKAGYGEDFEAHVKTASENKERGEKANGIEKWLPPPREKRWEWESHCLLDLSQCFLGRNEHKKAILALRIAALQIDSPQAYFELAKLLSPQVPEREVYLLKAAVSGFTEAGAMLSEMEKRRAEAAPDKKTAADHLRMSSEWAMVASDETPSLSARAGG